MTVQKSKINVQSRDSARMTDPKALAEKIAKECVDTFMDVMINGADIKRPKLLNRIIEDQVSKAIAEAYARAAEVAEKRCPHGKQNTHPKDCWYHTTATAIRGLKEKALKTGASKAYIIAAQIEEAERDKEKELLKLYYPNLKRAYVEGFSVARKKAKGIVLDRTCGESCDCCNNERDIADRIASMKPEEK